MATITIKNIPPKLYDLLKASAASNRRSINSEVITMIERGVGGGELEVEDVLARARRLRDKTRAHPIGDSSFRAAKRAGRP